jgi:hypothetical protein
LSRGGRATPISNSFSTLTFARRPGFRPRSRGRSHPSPTCCSMRMRKRRASRWTMCRKCRTMLPDCLRCSDSHGRSRKPARPWWQAKRPSVSLRELPRHPQGRPDDANKELIVRGEGKNRPGPARFATNLLTTLTATKTKRRSTKWVDGPSRGGSARQPFPDSRKRIFRPTVRWSRNSRPLQRPNPKLLKQLRTNGPKTGKNTQKQPSTT